MSIPKRTSAKEKEIAAQVQAALDKAKKAEKKVSPAAASRPRPSTPAAGRGKRKVGRPAAQEKSRGKMFYLPDAWGPMIDEIGAAEFGNGSGYVRGLIRKDLVKRGRI